MHMQMPRGMSDTGDLLVSIAWNSCQSEGLITEPKYCTLDVLPHVVPCSRNLTRLTRCTCNSNVYVQ